MLLVPSCTILYHLVPSCTFLYRLRCFKQDTGTIRIRDSDPKATSIIYRFEVLCPRATRTCTSLANFIGWTNNIQNEVVDSLQVFIRHSFRIIMHNIGELIRCSCLQAHRSSDSVWGTRPGREGSSRRKLWNPSKFAIHLSMHYAFQLSTFHRWCCGPPWATLGHHGLPWAIMGHHGLCKELKELRLPEAPRVLGPALITPILVSPA